LRAATALVVASASAACSGAERVDDYSLRHAVTEAPPPPKPAPSPPPSAAPPAPPPGPSDAELIGRCAPSFRESVVGPVADPEATSACNAVKDAFARLRPAMQKACDAGDAATCTMLGSMLGPLDWFGVELTVFVPPCHPRDRCWARYAKSVPTPYAGVSTDEKAALAALDEGCSLGGGAACEILGVAYFGKGDPRAIDTARRACGLGRGLDCRTLVERALKNKESIDPTTLREIVATETKACDAGSGASCVLLGSLVELGWSTEADAGAPHERYAKGCAAQQGVACAKIVFGQAAGKWSSPSSELQSAERVLEKACDASHALVCAALGIALDKGLGVAQDSLRGKQILSDACSHRAIDCDELPQ
jgi:TPR repeat protein